MPYPDGVVLFAIHGVDRLEWNPWSLVFKAHSDFQLMLLAHPRAQEVWNDPLNFQESLTWAFSIHHLLLAHHSLGKRSGQFGRAQAVTIEIDGVRSQG